MSVSVGFVSVPMTTASGWKKRTLFDNHDPTTPQPPVKLVNNAPFVLLSSFSLVIIVVAVDFASPPSFVALVACSSSFSFSFSVSFSFSFSFSVSVATTVPVSFSAERWRYVIKATATTIKRKTINATTRRMIPTTSPTEEEYRATFSSSDRAAATPPPPAPPPPPPPAPADPLLHTASIGAVNVQRPSFVVLSSILHSKAPFTHLPNTGPPITVHPSHGVGGSITSGRMNTWVGQVP